MREPALLALLVAAGLSAAMAAADHTIRQRGRMFSSDSVTIRRGETVTFLNDDNVPHNVVSVSTGNQFDLGSQPPGASTDVTFNEVGDVQVICAIHPRMKMTLKVTD